MSIFQSDHPPLCTNRQQLKLAKEKVELQEFMDLEKAYEVID